jgi:hypothetical protein
MEGLLVIIVFVLAAYLLKQSADQSWARELTEYERLVANPYDRDALKYFGGTLTDERRAHIEHLRADRQKG